MGGFSEVIEFAFQSSILRLEAILALAIAKYVLFEFHPALFLRLNLLVEKLVCILQLVLFANDFFVFEHFGAKLLQLIAEVALNVIQWNAIASH
jgi:hypothetical protein